MVRASSNSKASKKVEKAEQQQKNRFSVIRMKEGVADKPWFDHIVGPHAILAQWLLAYRKLVVDHRDQRVDKDNRTWNRVLGASADVSTAHKQRSEQQFAAAFGEIVIKPDPEDPEEVMLAFKKTDYLEELMSSVSIERVAAKMKQMKINKEDMDCMMVISLTSVCTLSLWYDPHAYKMCTFSVFSEVVTYESSHALANLGLKCSMRTMDPISIADTARDHFESLFSLSCFSFRFAHRVPVGNDGPAMPTFEAGTPRRTRKSSSRYGPKCGTCVNCTNKHRHKMCERRKEVRMRLEAEKAEKEQEEEEEEQKAGSSSDVSDDDEDDDEESESSDTAKDSSSTKKRKREEESKEEEEQASEPDVSPRVKKVAKKAMSNNEATEPAATAEAA